MRRKPDLRARQAQGQLQGMRRKPDLRARQAEEPVQGMRRKPDLRARQAEEQVQGFGLRSCEGRLSVADSQATLGQLAESRALGQCFFHGTRWWPAFGRGSSESIQSITVARSYDMPRSHRRHRTVAVPLCHYYMQLQPTRTGRGRCLGAGGLVIPQRHMPNLCRPRRHRIRVPCCAKVIGAAGPPTALRPRPPAARGL